MSGRRARVKLTSLGAIVLVCAACSGGRENAQREADRNRYVLTGRSGPVTVTNETPGRLTVSGRYVCDEIFRAADQTYSARLSGGTIESKVDQEVLFTIRVDAGTVVESEYELSATAGKVFDDEILLLNLDTLRGGAFELIEGGRLSECTLRLSGSTYEGKLSTISPLPSPSEQSP